jgi:hypothetical protein
MKYSLGAWHPFPYFRAALLLLLFFFSVFKRKIHALTCEEENGKCDLSKESTSAV